MTVEGLSEGDGKLHPIQEAFKEEHGLQCGFCTPGFMIAIYELLESNANPTDEEIKDVLGGQICRCTGYHAILRAVHNAAAKHVDAARRGKGPCFLLATCPRLDGHFLGDPLIRMARKPLAEGKDTFTKVIAAAMSRGGGGVKDRAGGMTRMMSVMARARRGPTRERRGDPILAARKAMKKHKTERDRIDAEVAAEIEAAVEAALTGFAENDGG